MFARLFLLLLPSLLAPTQASPFKRSDTVHCTAPWVEVAVFIVDKLPKSEGIDYCSSLLHKYTTTTSTKTISSTKTLTSYNDKVVTVPAQTTTQTLNPTALFSATETTVVTVFDDEVATALTPVTTDVVTTVSFEQDYATITDVKTDVVSITSFYTVSETLVTTATPISALKEKRGLAGLLGIAESLITGFCSCVATGPTSTVTVTATALATATVNKVITTTVSTATPAISIVTTVSSVSETVTETDVSSTTLTTTTSTFTPAVATAFITTLIATTSTSIVPTTVTTRTTLAITATRTDIVATCTATQAFTNGGFETGNLLGWQYTPGDGFFEESLTTESVVKNSAVAEEGSYYLYLATGANDIDLSFSLSQTLTGLCPGQQYRLSFYSDSTTAPAGAQSCLLNYCVGSTCASQDPGLSALPISNLHTLLYTPGPGVTTATFSVATTCCNGIFGNLCERSSVYLDNFQLVPVAST